MAKICFSQIFFVYLPKKEMNQKVFEFVKKTPAECFEVGNKILKQHPEFFRFLKEKGIYSEWMKNRHEYIFNFHSEAYPYSCFTDVSNHEGNVGYFLSLCQSSFSWDETPEGFSFWDKINRNWTIAAAKLNKKNTLL